MPRIGTVILIAGVGCCAMLSLARAGGTLPEYNPIRRSPISIGPEAARLIVGFRTTPGNAVTRTVRSRIKAQSFNITQADTSSADVSSLAQRSGMGLAKSRQITSSMHVIFLAKTLYGADVARALAKLRADPAVQFAVVDQRRYPHSGAVIPNDPLFMPTPGSAGGQWYLLAPNPAIVVDGVSTADLSATDAVDAWSITTGSPGIVIADVDTGVLFDHPDLQRAGFGGRLLPGYDFVGEDFKPSSPYNPLGTFLIANDGDGWDPDPSDPGDWISSSDKSNALFANDQVEGSSWHGTRVVGVFGAIANNDAGIAGMTWGSWILPVRALGKGGGYDSDIIAGIQWAAGLSVTNPDGSAVPENPYPADIINLSLGGGTDSCSSSDGAAYESALTTVTRLGVLVVISAGNASGAVELPGNCSTVVPGVMAVAGLRNAGTKVGYSSFGPQVSVSAPAGNCVTNGGNCLRSIDTSTDLGTTGPLGGSSYTYTNEMNVNLGTSFSAPIVSGIAALMRSVNDNLTPAQVAARMEASATHFPPNTGNLPVCPMLDTTDMSDQCSCPPSGQCGSGMVNAYSAVQAAQAPIAAVIVPGTIMAGSNVMLDAGGSAAACGRSISAYAWKASGGASIVSGGTTSKPTVQAGPGTITLTVTDNTGATDKATINVTSTSASSSAPKAAGSNACPTPLVVTPAPPTISQAFGPASVGETVKSTLTIKFMNSNGYDLTQASFSDNLPAGVRVASSPAPSTSCTGAGSLTTTSASVTLAGAIIPATGSCSITLSVSSAAAAAYKNTIAANALMTGPAGGNAAAASATLTVTAPLAPTLSEAFSPASVTENAVSTLTITLKNSNPFALFNTVFTDTLPSGLTVKSSPAPADTCGGSLSAASSSISLSGATIPASGSCTLTIPVMSASSGTYSNAVASNAVTTTPAGGASAAVSANLTVTAASKSGGGGALDWWDMMFVAGVLLAGRRQLGRRPPR
jgi:serine protease